MKIITNTIENTTQDLVEQFLNGEYFDLQLSRKVINAIDPIDEATYDEVVISVKRILKNTKKEDYCNVMLFTTDVTVTNKEKAVFIRMVNLSHKEAQCFIILNNEIVHHPSFFKKYSQSEIEVYVNSILKHREKEQLKLKIKTTIRNLFSPFRKGESHIKNKTPAVIRSNRKTESRAH